MYDIHGKHFPTYRDAFNAACDAARKYGRDVGLHASGPYYNNKGYCLAAVPANPKNRSGSELRWQIVTPTEPKMD